MSGVGRRATPDQRPNLRKLRDRRGRATVSSLIATRQGSPRLEVQQWSGRTSGHRRCRGRRRRTPPGHEVGELGGSEASTGSRSRDAPRPDSPVAEQPLAAPTAPAARPTFRTARTGSRSVPAWSAGAGATAGRCNQRVGSMIVTAATVAWSKSGSIAAASSRPMVPPTSRCGCREP
jgi:hypothetical protein